MQPVPIIKDVLLVGGGHSHALLIRRWAMQPLAGVRLTLISRDVLTPYSGMLPGLVAGHYQFEDAHIDLTRLCAWAGVRFIEAEMTQVDLQRRTVSMLNRPDLGFDLLSLDTGSTPDLGVPGAREFSIPVKPVHEFHAHWEMLRTRIAGGNEPVSLGVVGSGAGGFELIMAMRHALREADCTCHWFIRGNMPLRGRPERVGELALQSAIDAGVVIHRQFDVVKVTSNGVHAAEPRAQTAVQVLDDILWCTAARAPSWATDAGFDVDERGFIITDAHLRSVSHPFVFATGDIGTQRDTPSDKAGVFAVRQAPVLFDNIRRVLLQQPLKVYRPQRDFLSLMATGRKSAIGSRGPVVLSGRWIWRLKDHIDQKFMNLFRDLPPMQSSRMPLKVHPALTSGAAFDSSFIEPDAMRCSGCGSKVGADILQRVLFTLQPVQRFDVHSGISEAGDAAIVDCNARRQLVQSVDQLREIVSDPFVFGRITALHALSDVVTLRCEPQSAQALVTLPFATDSLVERDLSQLMAGAIEALNSANCSLVGGHTSEGSELQLGFVVNAFLNETTPVEELQADDRLILTQAIGTGVLFAGLMKSQTRGVDLRAALTAMQQSNQPAATVCFQHEAKLLTDVTGFGLLGHANHLLRASALHASIDVDAVPLFDGALNLAKFGISSTMLRHNRRVIGEFSGANALPEAWQGLLCDPQTGGGLLAVVPAATVDACLHELQQAGYSQASQIGTLQQMTQHSVHRV